jgi:uncharacterized protein (TIGR02300 family)
MTQTALGSKCRCLTCATLFFDLHRDPIRCPKCGEVFIPPTLPHSIPYRSRTPTPAPPLPFPVEASEESAVDDGAEADAEPESDGEDALEAKEADVPELEPNLLDPALDDDDDADPIAPAPDD